MTFKMRIVFSESVGNAINNPYRAVEYIYRIYLEGNRHDWKKWKERF